MSLRVILQITWSYISPLRPYMPTFKILMELRLRILTGLIIESLIITTIRVHIKVYTYSLIKGLIGRKYNYSLYYRAAYPKQQLCLPYNQASVIFIMLQLITISRSKWVLAPPYCGLTLMERQELANYILLLFSLLRSVLWQGLIVSRRHWFKPPLLGQLLLILMAGLHTIY